MTPWTLCVGAYVCLRVCVSVLIHEVKGVVGKGVTLTCTVSYHPGETGCIKQITELIEHRPPGELGVNIYS